MVSRRHVLAAIVVVAVVGIYLAMSSFGGREERSVGSGAGRQEASPPQTTAAARRPELDLSRLEVLGDITPMDLPEAHRPASIQSALEGYQQWLDETYPRADAEFLGTDCEAVPCLIGLRFTADAFTGPEALRAFYSGTKEELERRVGFTINYTNADEDRTGKQYLWVYGLPPEVDEETRATMVASAEDRHSARMDPLRPQAPPAIPGPGEPGYTGPLPAEP